MKAPDLARLGAAIATVALQLHPIKAFAADHPAPQEGNFVLRDFHFQSGETLPELRLHYRTVGAPGGEPVVVLHGTTGSGASMLTPSFAGELFGPGQSSKPSDGLRARFPRYSYGDMVEAQHRLVTEHLGVKHVRLVIGYSMGGMETWLWAARQPGFMDLAVPMASLPVAMSGRNWMMRRLIIDSIRGDPEWMNGNYAKQPKSAQFASVFYVLATSGGNQALYKAAPSRAVADKVVDDRLAAPFTADANDTLYQ